MRPKSALSTQQLQALDLLLRTQNISLAAAGLGLTQSAVSHTLARLREHYGDELLLRQGRAMVLTPFAADLLAPVGSVLRQIEDVSSLTERFDPQALRRGCVIAARDLTLSLVAPRLVRDFTEQAPAASLEIVPWDAVRLPDQLASGACDYAIGVDPPSADLGLKIQKLYSDGFVAVCAGSRAMDGPLSLEDIAAWPAIVASRTDGGASPVDDLLALRGLRRRVVMRSAYFLSALSIVRDTDLLMIVPRRLARKHAGDFGLDIMEVPALRTQFTVFGVGHERFASAGLYKWLRALCVAAVKASLDGEAEKFGALTPRV